MRAKSPFDLFWPICWLKIYRKNKYRNKILENTNNIHKVEKNKYISSSNKHPKYRVEQNIKSFKRESNSKSSIGCFPNVEQIQREIRRKVFGEGINIRKPFLVSIPCAVFPLPSPPRRLNPRCRCRRRTNRGEGARGEAEEEAKEVRRT
jgi:hypothetical protein